MRQLLDVVHQTEQPPLSVDLVIATQGEAAETLVVSQIAEHWLDRCEALSVLRAPILAVDAFAHQSGKPTHVPAIGLCVKSAGR